MSPSSLQPPLEEFLDLPVRIGRCSVKADKLHAMKHVTLGWVAGSQGTAFTQVDAVQLFANTAASVASSWSSQFPPLQGDTACCHDVKEATLLPSCWHQAVLVSEQSGSLAMPPAVL